MMSPPANSPATPETADLIAMKLVVWLIVQPISCEMLPYMMGIIIETPASATPHTRKPVRTFIQV